MGVTLAHLFMRLNEFHHAYTGCELHLLQIIPCINCMRSLLLIWNCQSHNRRPAAKEVKCFNSESTFFTSPLLLVTECYGADITAPVAARLPSQRFQGRQREREQERERARQKSSNNWRFYCPKLYKSSQFEKWAPVVLTSVLYSGKGRIDGHVPKS